MPFDLLQLASGAELAGPPCPWWGFSDAACLYGWRDFWGAIAGAVIGAVCAIAAAWIGAWALWRATKHQLADIRQQEARRRQEEALALLEALESDTSHTTGSIMQAAFSASDFCQQLDANKETGAWDQAKADAAISKLLTRFRDCAEEFHRNASRLDPSWRDMIVLEAAVASEVRLWSGQVRVHASTAYHTHKFIAELDAKTPNADERNPYIGELARAVDGTYDALGKLINILLAAKNKLLDERKK